MGEELRGDRRVGGRGTGAPPRLWLIDHGAALVFHHRWDTSAPDKAYNFRHHALGLYAPDTRAADAELAPRVTDELLREVTAEVPGAWLADDTGFATPDAARAAYVDYLSAGEGVRGLAAHGLPEPRGTGRRGRSPRGEDTTRPPGLLKRVPDLHGKLAAEQDWSVHLG